MNNLYKKKRENIIRKLNKRSEIIKNSRHGSIRIWLLVKRTRMEKRFAADEHFDVGNIFIRKSTDSQSNAVQKANMLKIFFHCSRLFGNRV